MSKVDEQINNQESNVPPKKRKTKVDEEFEQVKFESTEELASHTIEHQE